MGNHAVVTREDCMFCCHALQLTAFGISDAGARLGIYRVDDGGIETQTHGTFRLIKCGIVKFGEGDVVGCDVGCNVWQQARHHEAHQTGIAIRPQRRRIITAFIGPFVTH